MILNTWAICNDMRSVNVMLTDKLAELVGHFLI